MKLHLFVIYWDDASLLDPNCWSILDYVHITRRPFYKFNIWWLHCHSSHFLHPHPQCIFCPHISLLFLINSWQIFFKLEISILSFLQIFIVSYSLLFNWNIFWSSSNKPICWLLQAEWELDSVWFLRNYHWGARLWSKFKLLCSILQVFLGWYSLLLRH